MASEHIQFTISELQDIQFALLIAGDECRQHEEYDLCDVLCKLYDKINEVTINYQH